MGSPKTCIAILAFEKVSFGRKPLTILVARHFRDNCASGGLVRYGSASAASPDGRDIAAIAETIAWVAGGGHLNFCSESTQIVL